MNITPINGCVLVKLTNSYEYVAAPDKKYDTKTSGVVIAVDSDLDGVEGIAGSKVYFEEYKDGTTIEEDGEKYALIKFEDIRGVKNA